MLSRLIALAGNPELQDRIAIFNQSDRMIVAVADGAGGITGGAQAAEAIVNLVSARAAALKTAADCQLLLTEADQHISNDPIAGETTAILILVDSKQIVGASAGDSEAWFFNESALNLTHFQNRKPFIGSGAARPTCFTQPSAHGVLIAATDGLWKYTSSERIHAETQTGDLATLPQRLTDLVRLRSGALQDDVAVGVVSIE